MGEAATSLGVDPSTVSRRLVLLEEALDTTLFDRGRDGLRLTEAAEDLLPQAELVELGVARFARAADRLERDISGHVRVTCPPDVADVVVLPALRGLMEKHPGLRLSLLPSEETVDLNRRDADLALRIVRPKRGDLVVKRVLTVEWHPAATKKVAARYAPLTDLAAVPWIGWGPRRRSTSVSRWLDATGADPAIRTDSIMTHVTAALAGMGVALLPKPSIVHYRLVPLDFSTEASDAEQRRPSDGLFLVTHRSLKDVPRIRAVWECLVDHLRRRKDDNCR